MPLFEYHCSTCGHTVEVLQRDARVLETCGEDCVVSEEGEGQLTRKVSAHAVITSGGGSRAEAAPTGCGRCGDPDGSCA